MKKTTALLLFSFASLFQIIYAQGALSEGKHQINAGVGFSEWGIPIYIGLDYSAHKDVTIGTEFSFRSYQENFQNVKFRHNIVGISVNTNYHFNTIFTLPNNVDFYAGLNIGFYNWSSPNNYNGDKNSKLGVAGQIGGRYYLNNKFGLNLEFGGGNAFSGGKLGITFKL